MNITDELIEKMFSYLLLTDIQKVYEEHRSEYEDGAMQNENFKKNEIEEETNE